MKPFLPMLCALGLVACGAPTALCRGDACPDAGAEALDAGRDCGACPLHLPACDRSVGQCVVCTAQQGCYPDAPVCDVAANGGLGACLVCTPTAGCPGALGVCLIEGGQRRCVECAQASDCPFGACDPVRHLCLGHVADAGADAGARDAGSPDAGGGDAGAPDAGSFDGGCIARPPPPPCGIDCASGFTCLNGACVLNGRQGKVQVTLRWNTGEDVDLHVLEPLPGGGSCEIYYGDRTGSACGALGSLDLDSNAGCALDNVDIENVIYPPDAGVTPGTYEVRVDHWANCDPATTYVPYEVEVRNNGVVSGVCGVFTPSTPGWDAHGGANGGTTVLTFTVP